jgi:hypothetical protein
VTLAAGCRINVISGGLRGRLGTVLEVRGEIATLRLDRVPGWPFAQRAVVEVGRLVVVQADEQAQGARTWAAE